MQELIGIDAMYPDEKIFERTQIIEDLKK